MKKMKHLFSFMSYLVIATTAFAGPDQPVKQLLDGSLDQLKVDSARTVEDAKFFDVAYNSLLVKPYLVKNKISFRINSSSPFFLRSAFTATVRIRITSTLEDSSTTTLDTALTINYRPDSAYINESIYAFSDAYRVEMKVLQTTTNVGWDVWKALQLENELQSFPVYTFSCTDNAVQAVTNEGLDADTKEDELPVSWGTIPAADEYDLEWTYIDSSALASGRYNGASDPDPALIFENNCSRVTITATSYKIPLLYDNKGTLFFRVRSVQYQPGGGRSESAWSSDYLPDGLGSFEFNGHERSLNWQATTSFAEDGKRKSVVQYYDGSLRSRQTVTKDNSNLTTIVGESFYDHQGRPVIQVLPAPTLSGIIGYSRNFNIGLNGSAYDKDDFDVLEDPSDYCSAAAAAMKTDSGAARYYSAGNPEKETGINKFIPDAGGYPFTETQYTPDNTGRISSQGGVGPYHRVNSGHETKYFYGTPDQEELDALFGTEVGDRSHYFKNMVRDANGQYSVSYVDMHGRTIATALAGIPTTDMDNMGVDSNAVTVTRKLLDSTNNFVNGTVIQSSKSLLVAVPGLHTFSYSLHPDSLRLAGCDSNLICYDCLYDLRITISDDCNNQKLGGQAFDTVVHNFSLNAIDTSCDNATPGFSFTFNKYLQEGNYEITKKLTLSKYAEDYYRDSIFLIRNHCKNIDSFILEQRELLAGSTLCKPTCEACIDSLGTWDSFRERFMLRAGIENSDTASYQGMAWQAFQQAEADCNVLCNTNSEQNDIRKAMILDLTPPTGQYANIDSLQDIYSIFFTSIYDDGNPANDTLANYTKPSVYLDENGKPDMVYDEAAGKMVSPGQLSPEAFAAKFKPSWAAALLPYHPEYCKLTEIENLKLSYEWDVRFGAVETYQAAMEKGYLNPTNNNTAPYNTYNATGTPDTDPLSTTYNNGTNTYKTKLENQLLEYRNNNIGGSSGISLWGLATTVVLCGDSTNAGTCFTTYGSLDSAFAASNMCTGDLDMAWRSFRQMYLDVKREIIQAQVNTTCTGQPGSVSSATLLAAYHQPNFGDAIELLNANGLSYATSTSDPSNTNQQTREALDNYYEDNCKAYVEQWWQQLKPCNYSSVDSAIIIPRLIQVCKEGSDSSHIFGSSTVSPVSTYHYRSFEQVLKEYSSGTYDASCNAYLITAPKAYDQQKAMGNIDVWSKPDSCQCAVINNWYTKYQSSAQGDASFSAYLLRVANTEIANDKLDSLRQLCNGTITCEYLSTPIVLPPVLQCGIKDVCVPCDVVKQHYEEYQEEFPSSLPLIDSVDSVQLEKNFLFEKYMNNKLGFAKTAADYLSFIASCTIEGGTEPCDSLNTILTDFKAIQADTTECNPSLFDISTSSPLDPEDFPNLFQDGIFHIPEELQNLEDTLPVTRVFKRDKLCVGNEFTFEGRIKNPTENAVWPYSTSIAIKSNFVDLELNFMQVGGGHTFAESLAFAGYSVDDDNGLSNVLSDSSFVRSFEDWRVFKVVVKNNLFQVYLDDTLVRIIPYQGTINQLKSFGVLFKSYDGSVDYYKIYDEHGILQYIEEFEDCKPSASNYPNAFICYEDNCETDFTDYFNQRTDGSFTYHQIDSIYLAHCGKHVAVCQNTTSLSGPLLYGKSEPVFPPVTLDAIDNCSDSTFFAVSKGTELYNVYQDSIRNYFDSAYRAKCLQAYKYESFTVTKPNNEYHYTLYYYDQAGNLVKTVPPKGVDTSKFAWSIAWSDSVRLAVRDKDLLTPAHTLITQYRYNTLNQVVAQQTPDAGKSRNWYDKLGRLVLSQNAKQKAASGTEQNRLYSYTAYDQLGRITEVGEIKNATSNAMTDSISRVPSFLDTWINNSFAGKTQITLTVYDLPYTGFTGISPTPLAQANLRNRVSFTSFTLSGNPVTKYNQATFFTYDIHGNVDTLLQDYGNSGFAAVQNIMNTNGNRFKKIVYKYDLISGKVNHVAYQAGFPDQFFHRYSYDAENRLTDVETSVDSALWEKDARYEYYKHGPLARAVLGDQLVQGLDYAYTLQGWLKGVNSTSLKPVYDMGRDGDTTQSNRYVARDAFGFNLNYFSGDYSSINSSVLPFPGHSAYLNDAYRPLYNGNISSMAVSIGKFNDPVLYNYRYDRLNRLTEMDTWKGLNTSTNSWSAITLSTDYKERIAYDPNGNILKYLRNTAGTASAMDSMNYKYYAGTNRLSHIKDNASSGISSDDIEDQSANNYTYDEIGNMVSDASENQSVHWNVYGKITEINRSSAVNGNNAKRINYYYDAGGNRIGKRVSYFDSSIIAYTWYVRDASGNVMGVYTSKKDTTVSGVLANYDLSLSEQHIYGSSRLGLQSRIQNVEGSYTPGHIFSHYSGLRSYELSNHLGNVLATISDRKLGVPLSGDSSLIDHYEADVVSAQDYYPFGMLMEGRRFSAGKYRYGFNGKENDNEVKGMGNQQDYGMRIYDNRLGRFLSVDPLTKDYPWNSPYAFAENSPLENIDLDGSERFNFRLSFNSSGQLIATLQSRRDIIDRVTIVSQNGKRVTENRINQRQEYFINNRRTNLRTINQINNRQTNTSIVNMALSKIETDYKKFNSRFPDNYYEEFGKVLINFRINELKPTAKHEAAALSGGFNTVKNLLDNETNFNNGEGSSIFHIYENLVRRNDNTGYDKLLHFTFSAQHAYSSGTKVSSFLGIMKEGFKDEIPSWFNDDIGWDNNDMEANRSGIQFGQALKKYFNDKYGIDALRNKSRSVTDGQSPAINKSKD